MKPSDETLCSCGAENPADARFCIACRAPLHVATGVTVQLRTVRCRMCGAEAPAGSRFCPMCQTAFPDPQQPRQPRWQSTLPGWQQALMMVGFVAAGALLLRVLPIGLLVLLAIGAVVLATQSGDAGIIVGVVGIALIIGLAAVVLRVVPMPGLLLMIIGLPAVVALVRRRQHP